MLLSGLESQLDFSTNDFFLSLAGADLGGGWQTPSPQGLDPLTNQKVSPLPLFYDTHFRPTNPKIFLKAYLVPIYTNFEGARAPKKRNFLVKTF